ncbi:hypothetical protein DL764_007764 [Monosporascus ibericus]|uniref:Uncharacterized protein n=1 Tax=Monosporascus ibericus TaxID=155417 RepID=A0A4Q4T1E4_9PEZI|nr:hypothetical protein DL764_007764 [Monosporascus ibericus]
MRFPLPRESSATSKTIGPFKLIEDKKEFSSFMAATNYMADSLAEITQRNSGVHTDVTVQEVQLIRKYSYLLARIINQFDPDPVNLVEAVEAIGLDGTNWQDLVLDPLKPIQKLKPHQAVERENRFYYQLFDNGRPLYPPRAPYDGNVWNRAQPPTGHKRQRRGPHAVTRAKRLRGKNGEVPNNQESPDDGNGKGADQPGDDDDDNNDDDAFLFTEEDPKKFEAVDNVNAAVPEVNRNVREKLYKHTQFKILFKVWKVFNVFNDPDLLDEVIAEGYDAAAVKYVTFDNKERKVSFIWGTVSASERKP